MEGGQAFEKVIDGLVYRIAGPDDHATIWKLMIEEFYPKTPLNLHLGSTSEADVAEEFALPPGLFEQGVSLVVEDTDTKEIVAARVSSVVPRSSAKVHPLVGDPELGAKYPKDSAVYRVLTHAASSVDVYQHYNVDTVVDFKYLVVKQAMCGRNIAKHLIEFSIQVARAKGIPVVNVMAAHKHAERIFESLGFDRLSTLVLADYVDPLTGERPFEHIDSELLSHIALFAKRTV